MCSGEPTYMQRRNPVTNICAATNEEANEEANKEANKEADAYEEANTNKEADANEEANTYKEANANKEANTNEEANTNKEANDQAMMKFTFAELLFVLILFGFMPYCEHLQVTVRTKQSIEVVLPPPQ
jgi:uncharacterized membrane protein YdbT with pleckstrin-like domain